MGVFEAFVYVCGHLGAKLLIGPNFHHSSAKYRSCMLMYLAALRTDHEGLENGQRSKFWSKAPRPQQFPLSGLSRSPGSGTGS